MNRKKIIVEKFKESAQSVNPIVFIVATLCCFLIPVDTGLMLAFIIGALMLTGGTALFSFGSELSMSRIGGQIGARMTSTRKVWLILLLSFLLGAAITMAEPDLQVLAANVPSIDNMTLVVTVAAGVGFFLMLCMLRMLLGIPLQRMLLISYMVLAAAAAFIPRDMLPVAFDSGGVTTGPMTVPFIMAMGVGVASIRSDNGARDDSFGLVALCSVGPVLAVMLLGIIYGSGESASTGYLIAKYESTVDLGIGYLKAFPEYFADVARALLPIFAVFMLFQIFSLKLRKVPFIKIMIGIFYTYIGLVLFLTGVNVGFSPLGYMLGKQLAGSAMSWLLVPLAMVMGWFIINAEPAVQILNAQVEELTAGTVSARTMGLCLSIAVSAANGIAMLRVLTGISISYFLIPGYIIALALSFFVPPSFTGIAFDSGGVASGPLTAAFMLPMAMGACSAAGGNIMTDAFGLVAMVAMMPLISVQVMGAVYVIRNRSVKQRIAAIPPEPVEVIELWEV